ncbi:MAG: radical SAM protein [Lachnospiraceae bacterium]|nr:radical SAM protein [Lachnospiraceae bacterium]
MLTRFFRNPNGYYLYDAVINRLTPVSEELFDLLNDGSDDTKHNQNQEYAKLKAQGFFADADHVLKNPYDENYETLLDRGLSQLILQASQGCNMRCGYCPYTNNDGGGRVHRDLHMSYDTAKKAIDFFAIHSADIPELTIGFYGGEPLLNQDMIFRVIRYAKKKFLGKRLTFHMTTNATLLTDAVLQRFEQCEMNLTVSYDGPKEVHDRNRRFAATNKSTHDAVLRAIHKICKHYPNLKKNLILNMVIDPRKDFLSYQQCVSELPKDFPQNALQSNLVNSQGLVTAYDESEEFVAEYQHALFKRILINRGKRKETEKPDITHNKGAFDDMYASQALRQGASGETFYPSGLCIPGQRKLFVNIHGKFFPCEKVSETHDVLCMGDLENGFAYERCRQLLNIASLTEQECADCWCYRFCMSCLMYVSTTDGFSREERLRECRSCRAQATDMIYRYLALGNI